MGRLCRMLCREGGPLCFGLTGCLFSFGVLIELWRVMTSHAEIKWSPLYLLGRLDWFPVKSKTGMLIAIQAVILSGMYFVMCCYLIHAYRKAYYRLVPPWYMMHAYLLIYQLILIYKNLKQRRSKDALIVIGGTLINALLVAIAYAVMRWTRRPTPPPRQSGRAPSTLIQLAQNRRRWLRAR